MIWISIKCVTAFCLLVWLLYWLWEESDFQFFKKTMKKVSEINKAADDLKLEPISSYDEDYMEEDVCEGCGEAFGEGHCPLCCGISYACGSEECDFCNYADECAEDANKL